MSDGITLLSKRDYTEAFRNGAAIHRSVMRGANPKQELVRVIGRIDQAGLLTLYIRHDHSLTDGYRLIIQVNPKIAVHAKIMGYNGRNSVWYGLGLAIGKLFGEMNAFGWKRFACPRCGRESGHLVTTKATPNGISLVYCSYMCCQNEAFGAHNNVSKIDSCGDDGCGLYTYMGMVGEFRQVPLNVTHQSKVDEDVLQALRRWRAHAGAVASVCRTEENANLND